jgi:hypothetical protein
MAEVKSVFDQIHSAAEARAIAEAEAELDADKGIELDADKGITQEKVTEWLLKLAKGAITPTPCE